MDLDVIAERENKLKKVETRLKKDFVGLDDQISKIIDNLKIWFLMPDILTRPTIVNLWGMTGTGKTDLVRKLSKYLGFADRLVEIQMDSEVKTGWSSARTVRDALMYSDLSEGQPGIVLFDEFQRFRTIQGGSEVDHDKYNDIWMLLSDGVFNVGASDKRSALEEEIFTFEEYVERPKDKNEDEDETEIDRYRTRRVGLYKAKYFKKRARLKQDIIEIARLSMEEVLDLIRAQLDNEDLYTGDNYNKTLIFICGNLDAAYEMSQSVADADQDADLLHHFSKKINVVSIKKTLGRMFKPEQIARMGNNHVIYPCLCKNDYREIIQRTLNDILNTTHELTNITCTYDKEVLEVLYRNFVYPSQGVRPVFSGVGSFMSKILPKLLFESIATGTRDPVHIYYDEKSDKIYGELITGKHIDIDYDFDLDIIKNHIPKEKLAVFAVHEAGHALMCIHHFNHAPKFATIEITRFDGAFVIPVSVYETYTTTLQEIEVLLAGTVAEELIFGNTERTLGCHSDIIAATNLAATLVRHCAMTDRISYIVTPSLGDAARFNTALESTNDDLEEILQKCRENVRTYMLENTHILTKIVDMLLEKKAMRGKDFCELLEEEFPTLEFIDPMNLDTINQVSDYVPSYDKRYKEFRKTLKS